MSDRPAIVTVSASAAIDEDRLEQRIREIAEAVFDARAGTGRNPVPAEVWMRTGKAAQECGVTARRVNGMRRAGLIRARPLNVDAGRAKQLKYEVDVESLKAALNGEAARPSPRLVRGG
jgi:hypothetical protein